MVKALDGRYEAGRRAQVKVKLERTADCVVAGFRRFDDQALVGSLLLGLYDGDVLRHVGVVTSLGARQRAEVSGVVAPCVTELVGHPWARGFGLERSPLGRLKGSAGRWTPELELDWVPLRPELVAEVAFDHAEARRFRHPARFRRWRPDRDPATCTIDQLDRGRG
jgi:ATP-dependent DNA ligase